MHDYLCSMSKCPGHHNHKRISLSCLIAALAIILPSAVSAQRYPFYNLSIDNGLIQSQATSIVQDKSGHLWTGTYGGLSRYDGHSFTNYTIHDGLANNSIYALHIDRQERLWIGSMKGVSLFDGRQFRHFIFQSPENPLGNVVTAIETTPDGTAWCIAGHKLYNIREGKVQSVLPPGTGIDVTAILADNPGNIWVAVKGGKSIYRHRGPYWDSLALPSEKEPLYIHRFYEDHQQRLWLLTNHGLFRLDGNKIVLASAAGKPLSYLPSLLSMTQAGDNTYWLGTSTGAVHITDTSIQYYNKGNGLTDNGINCVFADAQNNIWFATDGQGLFRFSGAPFTALDEDMGLPSAQIMSMAADAGGTLYLGTYDAGLYRYTNGHATYVPFPDKIKPPIIAMATLHGDEIWLGTRGNGLWKYDAGANKITRASGLTPTCIPCQYIDDDSLLKYDAVANKKFMSQGLASNFTTCLYTDGDSLWIGLVNGVAIYSKGIFRRLPVTVTAVFDFLRIGQDSMLLATENGIKIYSGNKLKFFDAGAAADSSISQCLKLRGRELWIGTSDNGVISYNLDTKQSMVINRSNGMRSDFVYNLFADKTGTIWAGTGYGIHSIRITGGKPSVLFYGKGQGVKGLESNHNSVLGMPDGSIWFGTTNGALHHLPGAEAMAPAPVSIVLQSVLLFGQAIEDTSFYKNATSLYGVPVDLQLPYKKNNLTFTFHAISLNGGEGITYRYRMGGLEAPWSDWAQTNMVTFSALPPGNYKLHVQCSMDAEHPVHELEYPFEIITPFHKTGLFRLLVLIACILLGISLQYAANRRKQARLRLIEALRREEQGKVRQRTAEDFHDEIGNKLTRINVLTNVLKSKIGEGTADTRRIIDQIQDNTGQLYGGTRDILWSLKPSNDNLYEILHRIRDFGGELFGDTEIDFRFSGTDECWKEYRLPMDKSRNLIMIFKEALNNCLKYSEASRVTLDVALNGEDTLRMKLQDNGRGFDPELVKRGHGIDNMNVRTRRLDGHLSLCSKHGQGTLLELTFKIPPNKV